MSEQCACGSSRHDHSSGTFTHIDEPQKKPSAPEVEYEYYYGPCAGCGHPENFHPYEHDEDGEPYEGRCVVVVTSEVDGVTYTHLCDCNRYHKPRRVKEAKD